MASTIQIYNMALRHIGVSVAVASLSESSKERITMSSFFETDRRSVLRRYNWPFATSYPALGLVEENPNEDWAYSYRYPSAALKIRRVVTGLGRVDPNPPPYRVGRDAVGKLIYTDQSDAVIECTADITDSEQLDSDFVEALSWKLALSAAPSLSRLPKAVDLCRQMYEYTLAVATQSSANESQQNNPLDSEAVRARG